MNALSWVVPLLVVIVSCALVLAGIAHLVNKERRRWLDAERRLDDAREELATLRLKGLVGLWESGYYDQVRNKQAGKTP